MIGVYFYPRKAHGEDPAGITVSKRDSLPDGEFGLTEYVWGDASLWFVDEDKFTADERQSAYYAFRERLRWHCKQEHTKQKLSGINSSRPPKRARRALT